MAKIIDGPARGQTLELWKIPSYLRVVRTRDMKWKGIDHPKTTVKPHDAVVAYRLVEDKPDPQYAVVNPQPSQDDMRNNALWFRWVAKQNSNQ